MELDGSYVATTNPESWIAATIDHQLSKMSDHRRRWVFSAAATRYGREIASGGQPDLLDVFTAAVRDMAQL